MKEYDYIVIGTGSGLDLVNAVSRKSPNAKIAVIDKDTPGGICLTRGCIPSKILVYTAAVSNFIRRSGEFNIDAEIKNIDFKAVMDRMRRIIGRDIEHIRNGLTNSENIDYYQEVAEFTAPYTLKVGNETIMSKKIFLCTGSKPVIPPIDGLNETGYLTSKTFLDIEKLPRSIAIIGGGYIAAEYGHFLSSMGSKVTILGRNSQFLPDEEPEVSILARKVLQRSINIFTDHEVRKAEKTEEGKRLTSINLQDNSEVITNVDEILVAAGRTHNNDILHPERGGIKTTPDGYIAVNEYLQTSQRGVWALGDADGKYPFKHKANYESQLVYWNALMGRKIKADFHAVPHAVFTEPEIAGVAMREREAIAKYGEENILVGFYQHFDTARGEAMAAKDGFVKAIVERGSGRILGAHIIGPEASVLIQEIINLMYVNDERWYPIDEAMHIHPALSEVVQRAFDSLTSVAQYHHILEEHTDILN
jgi:mycothione reductase